MYILGINCFMHDSSAALIRDGRIVAMAEEERFTRLKHTNDFPYNSVKFCLEYAGIQLNDVEHIGYFWIPWKGVLKRSLVLLKHLPQYLSYSSGRSSIFRNMLRVPGILKNELGYKNKFHFIDHHSAHMASSYYGSEFERASIFIVDANGERDTVTFGLGEDGKIKKLHTIKYPHSLGLLYLCVTEYLGFRENSGEGKVMGLASYGVPRYYDKFLQIVDFSEKGTLRLDMSYFDVHINKANYVTEKFIDTFGPRRPREGVIERRHEDIAASLQKITEDACFSLLQRLYNITGSDNLCMTGGVALNSVMNGKIREKVPFRNIFILPPSNDSGTSLGAALYIYYGMLNNNQRFAFESPYLGPEYLEPEIGGYLSKYAEKLKFTRAGNENFTQTVAKLLAQGKIVGWFQGRMEVGPRALGNRSILADPRNPEMKDIMNIKVKHREDFRPFAPAILEEYLDEYFVSPQPEPWMLMVYPVKKSMAHLIPAVVHVDGTGRVQSVNKKHNPLFHDLINEFRKLTGIPVLLNTSFNVRGEPIVCSPEDAILCFLGTEMDHLVIGDYIVSKA